MENVSGLILAGGRGRRMAGVDKGLQLLAGRPLAAWAAMRLARQVSELIINANRGAEEYAKLGFAVVADSVGDFAGPLAGIHAGLSAASREWTAIAPCDSPLLPDNLVRKLMSAAKEKKAEVTVARTEHRTHPVFMLCRRNLRDDLGDFLKEGGRKIDLWYPRHSYAEVLFDDEDAFSNVNTPQELAEMELRLQKMNRI